MKTEDIKNLAKAWLSVTEKKKMEKMDPVGKADADIDNDGDTDKSDEYLHNRRKAIKKAMGKDKDMNTKNADKAMMHDCASHVVHKEHGEGICIPGMHTLEEQEDGTGVVTHYDVLFGEDNLQENVPVEDLEIVTESSHMHSKKKKNEEVELKAEEQEEPVAEQVKPTLRSNNVNNMLEALRQVWEKAAHGGSEETKDTKEKQLKRSKGEEDFVKKHNVDVVDGPAQEGDSIDKVKAGMKQAPGRSNDQKTGDKNVVNPVKK